MNTTKHKSPSQKVENAFKYILDKVNTRSSPLNGFTLRTGRPTEQEAETTQANMIDIWVTGAKVVPVLEDEWEAELHFRATVQSDDSNPKDLDSVIAYILDQFQYSEPVVMLVNYPLASRPEPDFWLVDVYQTGEDLDTNQRYYRDAPTYLVKFRNDNGQG